MKVSHIKFFVSGVAAMLLSSCNGIFEGIYDKPSDNTISEYGFISAPTTTLPGTIYIDATSYTDWVYLNFGDMSTTTLGVEEDAPAHWDIAIHRYDAKTNGGMVAATDATDFTAISNNNYTAGEFTADTWTEEQVITDVSNMVDGYLEYIASDYNTILSQWLDVDTTNMPPTYTLSNRIYIISLTDGRKIAVRLDNFMNSSSIKGYMTISYSVI
jgi:hypothetical protein